MIRVKNPLVLIVGNELLVCDKLSDIVIALFPQAEVLQSEYVPEVIMYIVACMEKGIRFDYVFLDGKMNSVIGSELMVKIKRYTPEAKIILYSGSEEEYLLRSLLFVDSIVIPPLSMKNVCNAMGGARLTDEPKAVKPKVRVHTFGNFDVFVGGKPLSFERKKAKELFAYLVDRKGAGASTSEIAAVLWEDRKYDNGIRSQTTRTISVLRKTLIQNGIGDVLVKAWNSLAVDPDKLLCDAYAYEKGEEWAVNSYRGEYMNNYSWAEFTNGKMQNNTE